MRWCLVAMLVLMPVLMSPDYEKNGSQQTYAVWKSYCLHITELTRMEAPLIDGQPNMKEAKAIDLKHDDSCWVYEVRRK